MSPEQLQARAILRARDLHTHVMRVRGRPGVYTVTSSENRRRRYVVVVRDGTEACSCPGFTYRQSCRHVEALRNRLGRERGPRNPLQAEMTLSVEDGRCDGANAEAAA
ncbi:MAG: hypothetical protein ACR2PL_04595 [Dehalococcoidia bacterium]